MKPLKCEVCGKKATKRYSPDLDIKGLGACRKHETDMFLAYMILIRDGKKEYQDFLKGIKK